MQLLERLCCARLPLKIVDDDDIEKCKVLLDARLIEADIPALNHGQRRSVFSAQAIVLCVTASGRAASANRSCARETSGDSFLEPIPPTAAPDEICHAV